MSISLLVVENLLKAAERMKLNRSELLAAAQVPGGLCSDQDGGIREEVFDRLWAAVDERQTRPILGQYAMEAAKSSAPACMGVAGALMATCKNLEEMIPVIERYRPLVGRLIIPSVEIRPNRVVFCFAAHNARVGELRSWNDAQVLSTIMFMETFTGTSWRPLEVRFHHGGERDQWYDEWFDCPIRFNCAYTGVVFPKDMSLYPFQPLPAGIANYLVAHAEQLLSRIDLNRSFSERVVEKIPPALSSRHNVASQIAHDLGVSERTMQRYLRSEGTSFGEVLARTRRELAEQYLDDGDLSIATIAELLGYSGATAFYQAFREWTGTTPVAYRERRPPKSYPRLSGRRGACGGAGAW
jgi:AraC-like DNA-binding protein